MAHQTPVGCDVFERVDRHGAVRSALAVVSFAKKSRNVLEIMVCFYRGCLLTCPLVGTLSLTLTVPLSFLADALLWQVRYPLRVYLGSIPMVLALVCAGLLSSPNLNGERTAPRDPLARWILMAWNKLTSPRNSFNRLVSILHV